MEDAELELSEMRKKSLKDRCEHIPVLDFDNVGRVPFAAYADLVNGDDDVLSYEDVEGEKIQKAEIHGLATKCGDVHRPTFLDAPLVLL